MSGIRFTPRIGTRVGPVYVGTTIHPSRVTAADIRRQRELRERKAAKRQARAAKRAARQARRLVAQINRQTEINRIQNARAARRVQPDDLSHARIISPETVRQAATTPRVSQPTRPLYGPQTPVFSYPGVQSPNNSPRYNRPTTYGPARHTTSTNPWLVALGMVLGTVVALFMLGMVGVAMGMVPAQPTTTPTHAPTSVSVGHVITHAPTHRA